MFKPIFIILNSILMIHSHPLQVVIPILVGINSITLLPDPLNEKQS